MRVLKIENRTAWHTLIAAFPQAHVLQTWDWGDFKQRTTGWLPQRYAFEMNGQVVAAASVLQRKLGPFSLIYVPKGPLFSTLDPVITDAVLSQLTKMYRLAVWIKIDPDIVLATGLSAQADSEDDQPYQPNEAGLAFQNMLKRQGWRFSTDQVQFRNTLTLDLKQTEDELLAGMNQSTRRKVRQAEKRGVTVRDGTADDLRTLYNIYALTGQRQDFIIRPWDYYRDLWEAFMLGELAHVLVAEHEGRVLAGCVLFHFADTAWYFYGMSSNEHRDLQPNYAIQWAALCWAKAKGYQTYDWWGAPNEFVEADPMWGVYSFKRGFGSTVVQTLGAWDYAPIPILYWLYTQAAPRFIQLLRRRQNKDA